MRAYLLLCMAPVLIAPAVGGTIYKWVDDTGATHYSQTAPPGKDAGEVRMPSAPSKAVTDAAIRKFQEHQMEVKRRDAEHEAEAKIRREVAMVDAAARMRRCSYAKHILHVLNKQRPVYTLDANDEEVYLSDAERAEKIRIMNGIAQSNCTSQ